MPRQHKIAVLDLGTSMMRGAVVQPSLQSDNLEIVSFIQIPSAGIRKGSIANIEDALRVIRQGISELEAIAGEKIRGVYVNFNSPQSNARLVKNAVAVSRADQEISQDDIDRVIADAETAAFAQNRETFHVIPRNFSVDGERGIKDPLGMKGKRLEATVLVLDGFAQHVKTMYKTFALANLDVHQIVFSPLCDAQAVLTKQQKELGVMVLDIGAATSSMAVYEEGDLLHAQIFPIGSAHITNDIAIGFQLDVEMAERLKKEQGRCGSEAQKKEMIKLASLGIESKAAISSKQLTEVIEARLLEIFELVNKELKKIDRVGLLPAGVVLTGGGSLLKGLPDFAKSELKLPAQLGKVHGVESEEHEISGPDYATVCGLSLWAKESLSVRTGRERIEGRGGFWKSLLRAVVP